MRFTYNLKLSLWYSQQFPFCPHVSSHTTQVASEMIRKFILLPEILTAAKFALIRKPLDANCHSVAYLEFGSVGGGGGSGLSHLFKGTVSFNSLSATGRVVRLSGISWKMPCTLQSTFFIFQVLKLALYRAAGNTLINNEGRSEIS